MASIVPTANHTPARALAFLPPPLPPWLLAAPGSTLALVDPAAGRGDSVLAQVDLLRGSVLHHLAISRHTDVTPSGADALIVAAGGKFVAALALTVDPPALDLVFCTSLRDFVTDVAVAGDGALVIALASSRILVADLAATLASAAAALCPPSPVVTLASGAVLPATAPLVLLAQYTVADWCILYATSIFAPSRDAIVVAVGSAFGDVNVWRLPPLPAEPGTPIVLDADHVESVVVGQGNRGCGAIANVLWSPCGRLLAVASDDRLGRIWVPSHAETRPATWSCLARLAGHSARVCDVAFVVPSPGELPTHAITVGEDVLAAMWRLNASTPASLDGELAECTALWSSHVGKNIWRAAVSPRLGVVATAGGDGGIKLWPLDQPRILRESTTHSPRVGSDGTNTIRALAALPDASYVAATRDGRILALQRPDCVWSELLALPATAARPARDFAALAIHHTASDALVAAGNRVGDVHLVQISAGNEPLAAVVEASEASAIIGVHWIEWNSAWSEGPGLAIAHANGVLVIWSVSYQPLALRPLARIAFLHRRKVTSMAHAVSRAGDVVTLACGDCRGRVTAVQLDVNASALGFDVTGAASPAPSPASTPASP
ncbi:uncharacterized protein AMSG_01003 [Thecamonas trahens ATCC 50062]|uniref:Uncharacterized protein n=1 Tax=Thecamonas trahens ATCC 50062 TaxID=461836 RepID=A0A0L0DIQ4_THETB|nr:hypothetical protein AMSG_01003 [Thecamonas trahens ATCC 50062]KNC52177.1 hypothetical protein AMSG_01003 [Thecamonas trahens ATCC 50062]|eukprot:XP_013762180.1 hypothetical protein AMSG_01003 [Thecamonas trahens ATCC 50062]